LNFIYVEVTQNCVPRTSHVHRLCFHPFCTDIKESEVILLVADIA